jgi:hypothetical protein
LKEDPWKLFQEGEGRRVSSKEAKRIKLTLINTEDKFSKELAQCRKVADYVIGRRELRSSRDLEMENRKQRRPANLLEIYILRKAPIALQCHL